MFGFTPGPCGCLSKDDRSWYRAHFCGLSNALRRHYGLWSRFLVNRDSAFLALIGSAVSPDEPLLAPAACCNPLGAKTMLVADNAMLRYAAAVTLSGLAVKLEDDGEDERGFRAAAAGLGRRWL